MDGGPRAKAQSLCPLPPRASKEQGLRLEIGKGSEEEGPGPVLSLQEGFILSVLLNLQISNNELS